MSVFFAGLRIKLLKAFYNDLNYSLTFSKYALEIKLYTYFLNKGISMKCFAICELLSSQIKKVGERSSKSCKFISSPLPGFNAVVLLFSVSFFVTTFFTSTAY